jgi:hypothetical protein
VTVAGLALAGCSDAVTDPQLRGTPSHPQYIDSFQLEGIEATGCLYGGEYPNCKPKPIDDGSAGVAPTPSSDPATGGSSGGGGGGSTDGSDPEPECDPQSDPQCEQPLTDVDKRVIQSVLTKFRRPDDQFTDPQARDLCSAMADRFSQIYAAGQVFRGATDTQPGDTIVGEHRGAYDPNTGHIHFDPGYLDKAASGDAYWERDLANDALHEAAHALGYNHGDSTNSPWGPIYAEWPFNLLSPGSNSCLNWN